MVVDVGDEAGRGVEIRVGGFVGAEEVVGVVWEGGVGIGGGVGGCREGRGRYRGRVGRRGFRG